MSKRGSLALACASALAVSLPLSATAAKGGNGKGRGHVEFTLEEATISDIHTAILARKLTVTQLVEMYLDRIKAYNGTCVNQPEGILGPITMKPHAGKVNAIMTLNLRPAARQAWGFDERKARSITDPVDADPTMPDALETAAALDAEFAKTGKLAGPLHGVVFGTIRRGDDHRQPAHLETGHTVVEDSATVDRRQHFDDLAQHR